MNVPNVCPKCNASPLTVLRYRKTKKGGVVTVVCPMCGHVFAYREEGK